MAVNSSKRTAIKWIRDGIKQKYKKGSCCEICGTTDGLEFHHYHTVAFLLENYAKAHGLSLSTKEEILAMRDEFYKTHWHELVEDAVTLCNTHHVLLHRIYGQKPLLSTADKQKHWVQKQYEKANGLVDTSDVRTGLSQYIDYTPKSLLDFMV